MLMLRSDGDSAGETLTLFVITTRMFMKRGSFCVLDVQPARAHQAAWELARRLLVQPLSIEALFLEAMESVAADNEVELPVVFAADRAGPLGAEWQNVRSLMEQAADRVFAELKTHAGMVPWARTGAPVATARASKVAFRREGIAMEFLGWGVRQECIAVAVSRVRTAQSSR